MVLLWQAGFASANPIRFDFTGTLTDVSIDTGSSLTALSYGSGTLAPGQTLSGFILFDSATPDTNPNVGNPDLASYDLIDIGFTIGGYTGGAGSRQWIQIINAHGGNPFFGDLYGIGVSDPAGPPIVGDPATTPSAPRRFGFDLIDRVLKTAIMDDLLPLTPPDLALFPERTWSLEFREPNPDPDPEATDFRHVVSGQITSLTRPAVPLPSTLLLLGLGIVGLLTRRSRPVDSPCAVRRQTSGYHHHESMG